MSSSLTRLYRMCAPPWATHGAHESLPHSLEHAHVIRANGWSLHPCTTSHLASVDLACVYTIMAKDNVLSPLIMHVITITVGILHVFMLIL